VFTGSVSAERRTSSHEIRIEGSAEAIPARLGARFCWQMSHPLRPHTKLLALLWPFQALTRLMAFNVAPAFSTCRASRCREILISFPS
jgi:hypothetical protein